jgi:hypothetical protein
MQNVELYRHKRQNILAKMESFAFTATITIILGVHPLVTARHRI